MTRFRGRLLLAAGLAPLVLFFVAGAVAKTMQSLRSDIVVDTRQADTLGCEPGTPMLHLNCDGDRLTVDCRGEEPGAK